MTARNRKNSTSNRMNISTALIIRPLSKLEVYKLGDILAHYRSLAVCSNIHLLVPIVADKTMSRMSGASDYIYSCFLSLK